MPELSQKIKECLCYAEQILKQKNYSPRTSALYLRYLEDYLTRIQGQREYMIRPDLPLIRHFLSEKQKQGCSISAVNLYLSAIQFFYREIIRAPQKINIPFLRRTQRVPVVLNREEINQILGAARSPIHHMIFSLAYASGLSASDLVHLKVQDVDSAHFLLRIKNRQTPLSMELAWKLDEIFERKKPDDFVFGNRPYISMTERALQKAFAITLQKTNIKKPATFLSLRHSFAVHLLEGGVDQRHVQTMLGHRHYRTIRIYTQMARPALPQIKSPSLTPH